MQVIEIRHIASTNGTADGKMNEDKGKEVGEERDVVAASSNTPGAYRWLPLAQLFSASPLPSEARQSMPIGACLVKDAGRWIGMLGLSCNGILVVSKPKFKAKKCAG